jgi:DNA gyrase subunit A
MTIRMGLDELRVLGRATQGVRLIELRKNDQIAAVAKVDSDLNVEELPEEDASPTDGEPEGGEAASDDSGTEVDNA